MTHPFDTATDVVADGPGRFSVTVDTGWNAPNGPNGGYLAALLLRAVRLGVADPARRPRTLTLHFLRAPRGGAATILVDVVRSGRSVTSVAVRLEQDGEAYVLGLCALAVEQSAALVYADRRPPEVRRSWQEQRIVRPATQSDGLFTKVEIRPAIGPRPFSSAEEALTGGWLRFATPRPIDHLALAMWADAWWPAPFVRTDGPIGAPTIELTIHFRGTIDPDEDPEAPVLAVFSSSTAVEGFAEEDGELWSAGGVLLAQSRQLALLREWRA